MNQADFRIMIQEGGPYLVSGGVPLLRRYPAKSAEGEPLEWEPVGAAEDIPLPTAGRYLLCRCGRTGAPPFCDGAHRPADFLGALTADRRPIAARWEVFIGPGVRLYDDRSLCADAGFCATRLTTVWDMVARADDPEARARLLRMVANCPAGRLTAALGDAGPLEPEYRPSIAVVPDGPLWARGGIPLVAPDGFVYETRNRVTLCRCGQSQNMPFCDGAHARTGFRAPCGGAAR